MRTTQHEITSPLKKQTLNTNCKHMSTHAINNAQCPLARLREHNYHKHDHKHHKQHANHSHKCKSTRHSSNQTNIASRHTSMKPIQVSFLCLTAVPATMLPLPCNNSDHPISVDAAKSISSSTRAKRVHFFLSAVSLTNLCGLGCRCGGRYRWASCFTGFAFC